jgi:hypothetical protein
VRPRFLADADLKRSIVTGVKRREPSVDFQSAQTAALEGLEDPEVLAIAAQDGRILVSHDFGTMPRHFRSFVSSRKSPGVFLISQESPVGPEAVEWENQLTYLPV